jgi:hypothetical protein
MKAPYDFRRITQSVYGDRKPIEGEVVALLHISFEDRGLKLIETKSRVVKAGEIHELMITDEDAAAPGGGADRVRAIAFFEVKGPGLLVVGDRADVSGLELGILAGYDETHMPNHMNIVVRSKSLDEPSICVGSIVRFTQT